ncbi:hypothetical protein LC593_21620 [Nostoc sp. CHAB 5844]|nr:hypothetical protein [Nostoc sp. CHAB 5844]
MGDSDPPRLEKFAQVEPLRCGETSAEGGFPSVGNWRTRREVPSVVASGVAEPPTQLFAN